MSGCSRLHDLCNAKLMQLLSCAYTHRTHNSCQAAAACVTCVLHFALNILGPCSHLPHSRTHVQDAERMSGRSRMRDLCNTILH